MGAISAVPGSRLPTSLEPLEIELGADDALEVCAIFRV